MNRDEIDTLLSKAVKASVDDGEEFTRYHFAELVIEAERNRLARECAMLPFGDTAASFAVWIKNGGKA